MTYQTKTKGALRLRAAALIMLALLIIISTACMADAARKVDLIAGQWRWYDNTLINLQADGTATSPGNTGTWCCTTKATPPTYVITWRGGLYVDTVYLSQSGNELRGKNEQGLAIPARRLPDLRSAWISFAFLTVCLPFMIRYAFVEKCTRFAWQSRINSVFFKPFRPDTSEAAYQRFRLGYQLAFAFFGLFWACLLDYLLQSR
jgi:hypothetical protein